MQDRISTYQGRVTLTPVSGQVNTYDMVRADSPEQTGTPLNTENLLSQRASATILTLAGVEPENPSEAFIQLSKVLYPLKKEAVGIASGSYTGTGASSGTFLTETFEFTPMVVIVIDSTGAAGTSSNPAALYTFFAVQGASQLSRLDHNGYETPVDVTWDDYTVTLANGTGLNTSGHIYKWVVIGQIPDTGVIDEDEIDWEAAVLALIDDTLTLSDHAADAKAVGDAIDAAVDDLKSAISQIEEPYGVNLFNYETVKHSVFLNVSTGEEEVNSQYNASDYIAVTAGSVHIIRTFVYSGTPSYRIYFYKADKTYIRRNVDRIENHSTGYAFTTPSDCAYIRLNFETGTNTGGTQDESTTVLVQGGTTISEYISYYTAYDRTARVMIDELVAKTFKRNSNVGITDADAITDIGYIYASASVVSNLPKTVGAWYLWTTWLDANNKLQLAYEARGTSAFVRTSVNGTWGAWKEFAMSEDMTSYLTKAEAYETSTIALFPSVGCCGDSFTAGYLYNKTDSQWYDPDYVPNGEYPVIGYPAVMGRLYGVDVTAYAKGGLTSTEYRTDSRGLPALLADTPKYLYIIALGLNDKTQNVPLGVEADIDTEPSTPTYLGNMGAIIRAIKDHAPYARIILCKSLWMDTAYYNYISEGVNLLSSHLGIPYIETLGDPYFDSSAYKDGLKGLHPTAPLYAGIGKRMGELVGKCIIDNPDYFYNFYVPNET